MQIIDTHSHIYQPDFDEDLVNVIERSKSVGIEHILLPNIDLESIERVHKLEKQFPGYCLPMMGMHPCDVTVDWKKDLAEMKIQFQKHQYIAVGEIGLDLYWDKSLIKEQIAAFEEQLRWSIEYDLPVAIHSRDATMEAVEVVKTVGAEKLRGVFHSFGGTTDELRAVLDLNTFYLGINGVVTFKNSGLADVLSHTDLSRIVLETDSPYLSPVPYRGKRNESSYIVKVVERLSQIYNLPQEEIAAITTKNAKELFSI